MTYTESIAEMFKISQTPPPFGNWLFAFYGSTKSAALHHFVNEKIAATFDLMMHMTESPVPQIRDYVASLASPQMATGDDGRWVMREEEAAK